jgi:hypothetical protein
VHRLVVDDAAAAADVEDAPTYRSCCSEAVDASLLGGVESIGTCKAFMSHSKPSSARSHQFDIAQRTRRFEDALDIKSLVQNGCVISA